MVKHGHQKPANLLFFAMQELSLPNKLNLQNFKEWN
jgi:hypothetical protein